jgi:hypothetical protein
LNPNTPLYAQGVFMVSLLTKAARLKASYIILGYLGEVKEMIDK